MKLRIGLSIQVAGLPGEILGLTAESARVKFAGEIKTVPRSMVGGTRGRQPKQKLLFDVKPELPPPVPRPKRECGMAYTMAEYHHMHRDARTLPDPPGTPPAGVGVRLDPEADARYREIFARKRLQASIAESDEDRVSTRLSAPVGSFVYGRAGLSGVGRARA